MITLSLNDALAIARKEIDNVNDAYLFNGTMFCRCSARQAARIETALLESCDMGVIVSACGDEFSFDFV